MKIEKFGLEIRKIGNVKDFFRDVDIILDRHNVPSVGVSASMQRMAVVHALQEMFAPDKWFNVCTIDKCTKLCGLVISNDRYNMYSLSHCIHWSSMLPEYREMLTAMVLDDFRSILAYDPNEIVVNQVINRN